MTFVNSVIIISHLIIYLLLHCQDDFIFFGALMELFRAFLSQNISDFWYITPLISIVFVISHLNSSVPLHNMEHPILGVQFLILGFEIVVNEIISSSERICVGFPL